MIGVVDRERERVIAGEPQEPARQGILQRARVPAAVGEIQQARPAGVVVRDPSWFGLEEHIPHAFGHRRSDRVFRESSKELLGQGLGD